MGGIGKQIRVSVGTFAHLEGVGKGIVSGKGVGRVPSLGPLVAPRCLFELVAYGG